VIYAGAFAPRLVKRGVSGVSQTPSILEFQIKMKILVEQKNGHWVVSFQVI